MGDGEDIAARLRTLNERKADRPVTRLQHAITGPEEGQIPAAFRLAEELGFDFTALRSKYIEERDKRLLKDGSNQYTGMDEEFAHYIEDPYIDAELSREPL